MLGPQGRWPANAIFWHHFARPGLAGHISRSARQGVEAGRGAVIRHIGTYPVAASSPTSRGSTMTTGYVAIVALSCILVVAVIALIVIDDLPAPPR